MHDNQVKRLVLSGILSGIIIVLTALVSLPLPGGHGYINLGDAGVLVAAFVLGGPWGALCAGIASGISDVLLGWSVYAPATFVIKGCMALLASVAIKKRGGKLRAWAVYPVALLVPLGYLLFETLLYGKAAALPNVPLNVAQCLVGAALAHAVIAVLYQKGLVQKLLIANGGGVTKAPLAEPIVDREPKGGPDVIFVGDAETLDVMRKAADILSVQGHTARIVVLAQGAGLSDLTAVQREKALSGGAPYICGIAQNAGANALAKDALEAIAK